MANRVPLIVDTSTLYIKELPTGDNLDLTGSGIVGLTGIGGTTGNFSGIVTASAYYVSATQVISSARQLQNIASLDATTTATIESAIANAPNTFTDLNITGISTLGVTSATNLTAQQLNVSGIGTITTFNSTNGTITNLSVVNVNASGIITSVLLNVGVGGTIITTVNTTRVGINSTSPQTTLDIGGTASIKVPVGTTAERPASATIGFVRFNTDLNTYEGYNGSEWGGLGGASEKDTAVATTSVTTCDTFAISTHRSATIVAQITQGSNYQVGKYLVIHDGTTASVIEESAIATGSMLGTFTVSISGANVLFRVNMTSASSATVTTLMTKVSV